MSGKRPDAGTMSADLAALLQSAAGADVTLVVDGCQLPAHSQILAARSPVFAAMMRHDTQEARSRRIEIPDMREEVLRQLLSFVYSDETPQLADVAGELLVAADKYDIPLLKSRCAQQLQRDLNVENAATAAALAVRHCCPELQSAAVSFVAHHPGVMATDSWSQVLRDDTETAVEICKQVAAAALQPVTQGESAELQSPNSSTTAMSEKRPEAGTMSSDFSALLQSAEGADVTLVVGGCQLPAHSQILAARSPIFAVRHNMQEARSRRIEIPDVREEVLRQLLSFVYSDETPLLADVAGELLVAADIYDLPLLKSRCAQQLQRDLNVENATTAAALAVRHCCPELQSAAVSFVARHPGVMATDSWARVLEDNTKAAVELCRQLAVALQPVTEGESAELQSSDSRELTEENGKRLIEAAKKGAAEEVQALLAAGAKVEARDEHKLTPLHWAAYNGHVEVVRCLLSAGAVVDSRNVAQETPLLLAAANGHAAVVRLLVASSAYHSARNKYGMTPLHYAARDGHLEATAALLDLGADKEARNNKGSTPLDVAKNNKRQQVVDMLT